MRITYFGYEFTELKSGNKHLINATKILKAFCALNNAAYKNKFLHNEEHIYLIHQMGGLFLLVQTREKEIIKKINSSDITASEIHDLLDTDERIGFASYILMKDSFFGFSSTVLAPKVKAFECMINNILKSVGVLDYVFSVHPFISQATKAEALSLPFIGASTIQINHNNSMFEDLAKVIFGDGDSGFNDLDSLEVIIRPKSRENIEKQAKKMINRFAGTGVDKFVLRAKEELHDGLIDIYLEGNGLLYDTIRDPNEKELLTIFNEKVSNNKSLQERVEAYEQDDIFEKDGVDSISVFNDVSAWTGRIRDI